MVLVTGALLGTVLQQPLGALALSLVFFPVKDIGWMLLGFLIASRVPFWVSAVLAVGFELMTLAIIRDNLTLNVLMLVWPVDAIRVWQAGG